MVADRLTSLFCELLIQLDAVFLKLHDVQAGAERRKVARGVPGGSRRQFKLLHQHDIRPARFGQMVKRAHTSNTTTNH
ncbi:hypothetical protein D3C80_2135290 [compost metagenome]